MPSWYGKLWALATTFSTWEAVTFVVKVEHWPRVAARGEEG